MATQFVDEVSKLSTFIFLSVQSLITSSRNQYICSKIQKVSNTLISSIQEVLKELYSHEVAEDQIQLQKTRKDFEGDVTLVAFPLLRISKKGPEQTGQEIGNALVAKVENVEKFNVVKGFLNLSFTANYWVSELANISETANYGFREKGDHSRNIMVEYSSPNTNKPLHLGHIRNNLLGYSVAEILKANGHEVRKVQIINDRGIHICKSMLAWQMFGKGESPQSSGLKGDKLVGKYYVEFDKHYKKQIAELVDSGKTEDEAKAEAPIIVDAREMLQKWEAGDEEVRALWAKMNGWVYEGFDKTYNRLGVDFDQLYYESDTFLIGRDLVQKGVQDGLFFQKEDGSIWVDLTDDGLDQKLLLRSDGTAVYMTQDIGTAKLRVDDWPELNQLIYTVGNEQDYHFKVLFLILQKLGFDWAKNCYHLSYGMVDLPSGKMKSREGTVVDADDLMDEMHETAKAQTIEKGKLEGMAEEEANELFEMLGLGALKYFMLKVDPKKRMLFNPAESIDMQGNTGPFIQYTHARIQSVLRKAGTIPTVSELESINDNERALIRLISQYPEVIQQAGDEYSPALIANYIYELAKEYSTFYHECPILVEEDENVKNLRLTISAITAKIIASGMKLLGAQVPDRM
ncbi:MAG: arginine--tRNA ligase [Flavobacteriales bacterium]|nr:arginine--tRNA ligase [Flavobacteriales bacterium]MCB9191613.1 arginine--tRNA ligase [Flavobacteriales bacterium]MCB9204427.1 arginine--tRNA ligase [Flavobacteriales bacterium]